LTVNPTQFKFLPRWSWDSKNIHTFSQKSPTGFL
jgi:hypothetical protein